MKKKIKGGELKLMDSLEVIILAVLIVQNVSWYIYLHMRLNGLERNTETGLKNQQEIKTKLTNITPFTSKFHALKETSVRYADGS
jgi:Tfp pilus assembly protein PilO